MWAKKSAEPRRKFKSSFVRAARRLGLLNDAQATKADALIEGDLEHSSQDILIHAGYLSEREARQVEERRKTEDLEGHLDEQFRRASVAIEDQKTSAEELVDVTMPMKKVEVG